MKNFKITRITLLFIFIFCGATALKAQTPNYTPGSVWTVSMIKTKANMSIEYINSLKANWKAVHDEAKSQGLIISYKILSGNAANPEDFDIMFLVESKNLAAMEGNEEKWDAIRKKVMGGDDAASALNQSRLNVREPYGSKMMREVVYK
jgi:hypothetical protein